MQYNKDRNFKYVKAIIPKDRLLQYQKDIRIELLEEVERKAQMFIFEHIKECGCDIIKGNADALNDLRLWISEKKVEINTIEEIR